MGFTDKLKAKATELGLDKKAQQAKEKAAAAAGDNRGKIADVVQKAGTTINDKTGGKYADKVAKAQGAAMTGVDKVATTGAGSGAAGTTTGDFGDTTVGTESAIDRSIGQDGMKTSDEHFGNQSPVDRAIGADAPTSAIAPDTSSQENDALGGENRAAMEGFGENQDTTDGFGDDAGARDVNNADIDNAPVTDPEINAVSGEAETNAAVRRGTDALPEEGPHGDTLR